MTKTTTATNETTATRKRARRGPKGVYYDKARKSWYYIVDAPGADGKRRQMHKRGFATQQAASDARTAFANEIKAGRVPVPADDSVAAFANAWIAALPAEEVEAATVRNYAECVNRLLPTIGALKLQDLTALDLDSSYTALRELGRSARTVRASHVAVKKMLAEVAPGREGGRERRGRRTTSEGRGDDREAISDMDVRAAPPIPRCRSGPAIFGSLARRRSNRDASGRDRRSQVGGHRPRRRDDPGMPFGRTGARRLLRQGAEV
jgi:hypothetical protein